MGTIFSLISIFFSLLIILIIYFSTFDDLMEPEFFGIKRIFRFYYLIYYRIYRKLFPYKQDYNHLIIKKNNLNLEDREKFCKELTRSITQLILDSDEYE